MSEVLTVPTAFGDISDMAQGLVDRVDEQQIILYGPSAYEEGSLLGFEVLLLDGSTALEGRGIVAASVDGGEDRDPATRFDIVLQGLEFDGVAEVVFERMVSARLSMVGDAPVDVSKSEPPPPLDELVAEAAAEAAAEVGAEAEVDLAADAPAPEAADEGGFDNGGFDDESTVVAGAEHMEAIAASAEEEAAAEPSPAASEPPPADEPAPVAARRYSEDALTEPPPEEDEEKRPAPSRSFAEPASHSSSGSLAASPRSFAPAQREKDSLYPAGADLPIRPGAPPPEQPAPPSGFAIDNSLSGGLVRPHTVWSPVAPPRPEPRPSSGLFQYAAGPIPIPARPPRPDLDPSLRVDRAPAPIREGEAPTLSEAPAPRASRPRRADFDDAMMADAVDLDPVSADD